jgi:hypothetical protein
MDWLRPQKRARFAKTTKREVLSSIWYSGQWAKNLKRHQEYGAILASSDWPKKSKKSVRRNRQKYWAVFKLFCDNPPNATNGEFSETTSANCSRENLLRNGVKKCAVAFVAKTMVQEDYASSHSFRFFFSETGRRGWRKKWPGWFWRRLINCINRKRMRSSLRTQFPGNIDYTRFARIPNAGLYLQKRRGTTTMLLDARTERNGGNVDGQMPHKDAVCHRNLRGLVFPQYPTAASAPHKYEGHGRRMLFHELRSWAAERVAVERCHRV